MLLRLGMVLLVLALPAVSRAEEKKAPERLLPAGSQLYARWDGFAGHQEAYEKTAVAKMMKGDTGKFLKALRQQIGDQLGTLMAAQIDPQVAQRLREDCAAFLDTVGEHGFLLGVELRNLDPVEAELIVVMPKSGAEQKSFLSLLRGMMSLSGRQINVANVGGRKAEHLDGGPVHLVWWSEGEDAVLAFGTDTAEALLKRLDGQGAGLAGQPLYKHLKEFKEFQTWSRGYLDLAGLAKVVRTRSPEVDKLIAELGLDSLKSLTFLSGFDGAAERGVVQLDVPGPRKGLLSLLSRTTFTLDDLPPMPPDINYFAASSVEMGNFYDTMVKAVESAVRIFAPKEVHKIQAALDQVETALGVKLGEDVFGTLGNMVVQYSASAEGPLGLGQVTLVKVKDVRKLEKSLDTLMQSLQNIPNVQLSVKKSKYRGVELHQLHFGGEGFIFYTPTFAIHKGWLVYSNYPQPVQGFILRSNGTLPAWKASQEVQEVMEKLPREFVGLQVSDPRPALKVILSVAPTAVGVMNRLLRQFGQGPGLDAGLVPNAYEATQHLFPNVSITTDDGGRVRSVTRSSLMLPF